jgi:hypothetical protein
MGNENGQASAASPTAKSELPSPQTTFGDGERGEQEDEGGANGQPKAKRRRVAVACKSCRYRKSRVSCFVLCGFLSAGCLDLTYARHVFLLPLPLCRVYLSFGKAV